MSDDPRRLLDDLPELSDAERRALGAARDVRPPSHFAGVAWTSLAAKVAGTAAGAGTGAGAAAGTGAGAGAAAGAGAGAGTGAVGAVVGSTGIVKALVVGAVMGAAALGGRGAWVAVTKPSAPAEPNRTSIVSTAVSPTTPAAPKIEINEPTHLHSFPAEPEPAPVEAKVPPLRPSTPLTDNAAVNPRVGTAPASPLDDAPRADPFRASTAPGAGAPLTPEGAREESKLVSSAREALLSGNASQALGLLEQARRRFPSGTLSQERETLTIEAMARSGQRAAAAERARAFARENPGSPYTARVQAVLSAP